MRPRGELIDHVSVTLGTPHSNLCSVSSKEDDCKPGRRRLQVFRAVCTYLCAGCLKFCYKMVAHWQAKNEVSLRSLPKEQRPSFGILRPAHIASPNCNSASVLYPV